VVSPFEQAVLLALVDGDTPEAAILREQVESVSVRAREQHGDAGFVVFLSVSPTAPPRDINPVVRSG